MWAKWLSVQGVIPPMGSTDTPERVKKQLCQFYLQQVFYWLFSCLVNGNWAPSYVLHNEGTAVKMAVHKKWLIKWLKVKGFIKLFIKEAGIFNLLWSRIWTVLVAKLELGYSMQIKDLLKHHFRFIILFLYVKMLKNLRFLILFISKMIFRLSMTGWMCPTRAHQAENQ